MATRKWPTTRVSDAEVLARFARIHVCMGSPPTRISGQIFGTPLGKYDLGNDPTPAAQQLLKGETSSANLHFTIQQLNLGVHLNRVDGQSYDHLELHIPDGHDALEVLAFTACVEREFPAHIRAEAVEKLLGRELAEFYQARETALLKLEGVNQRLIEETAAYRLRVDQQAAQAQTQRIEALSAERETMMQAVASERAALDARAADIAAEKQRVDDRASKYARRGLRESLQASIQAYSTRFALTVETSDKRKIVQWLFSVTIVLSAVLVALTLVEQWKLDHSWHYYLRVGLGSLTIIGAIVFNIRWADSWFNRLADEELRLKRLGLDIDRASWLVETAMEWQQDYKAPIPDLLLQELSQDLFTSTQTESVRHPAEDAMGAVLGAASSLKLNIPGVGTAMMNRKDLRSLRDKGQPA